MILTDLADGEPVFLDANILVYHFAPHPGSAKRATSWFAGSISRRFLATPPLRCPAT